MLAVVVIVRVDVVPALVGVTEVGLSEQVGDVDELGVTAQVSETLLLKPPAEPRFTVAVEDCPGVTLAADRAETVREKPGATPDPRTIPDPERAICCGLATALSVILITALRLPVADGAKVTEIVQLLSLGIDRPQLLVWLKSPALVPVTVMLPKIRLVPLGILMVTAFTALAVPTVWPENARLLGDSKTLGGVATSEAIRRMRCARESATKRFP